MSKESMHSAQAAGARFLSPLGLLVLFVCGYLSTLGVRPLVVPDETRYAEIPREMLSSGNWISPRLNDLRYFEKPVLGYWLNAFSFKIFGLNEFALRLPSALSVLLSAFLIYLLISKTCKAEPKLASVAALIYMSATSVFTTGSFAVLDSMFSVSVSAAVVCFYIGQQRQDDHARSLHWYCLAGISVGLAFLTKGILGVVLPGLPLFVYLIWSKRSRLMLMRGWTVALCAVIVVLPWSLAIHSQESDFWRYFFWEEHVKRFLSPEAQHPKPAWFFIPVLLAGFIPWAFLIPAGLKGLTNSGEHFASLRRLSWCWLILPFLFLSASKGKLQTYILPCFPPLSVLLAIGLHSLIEIEDYVWIKRAIRIFSFVVFLLALVLIITQSGLVPRAVVYGSDEQFRWVVLAVGLAFWASLLLSIGRLEKTPIPLVGISAFILYLLLPFCMPSVINAAPTPGVLLEKSSLLKNPSSIVVCNDKLLSAVTWYGKRTDVRIVGGSGESEYGLRSEMQTALSTEELRQLISSPSRKLPLLLVAYKKYFDVYSEGLSIVPTRSWSEGNIIVAEF